jgi:hypothetical protein
VAIGVFRLLAAIIIYLLTPSKSFTDRVPRQAG